MNEHPEQRLFHFTALMWLPGIFREGLNRGDAPATIDRCLSGVNLTTSPSRHAQRFWLNTQENRKSAARLTVTIPKDDTRLESYVAFWDRMGTPRWYRDGLDPTGQRKFWWIFWGTIPPDSIYLWLREEDGDEYRPVAGDELRSLLSEIEAEIERAFVFSELRCSDGAINAAARFKPGVSDSWLL